MDAGGGGGAPSFSPGTVTELGAFVRQAIAKVNRAKKDLLYKAIDASDFYTNPIQPSARRSAKSANAPKPTALSRLPSTVLPLASLTMRPLSSSSV